VPSTTSVTTADGQAPTRRRQVSPALYAGAAVLVALVAAVVVIVVRSTDRTGLTAGVGHNSAGPGPARPRLVWSDEFDGTRLNPAKWTIENESTFGDGNGEVACLMNRPQNVSVRDGVLSLRARREPTPLPCGEDPRFPGGRQYSSAMISTRDRAAWHTGIFVVRAKLPTGAGSQGLWPAFWMRPQSAADGTGEIDGFEAVGSPAGGGTETGLVHQTVWSAGAGSPKRSHTVRVPGGGPSAAFHTYAVRWTEDSITWSVDGRVTFTCDRTTAPWLADALRGKFFLRLNLAVGGSWPGPPNAATVLPQSMQIDWVRVYQTT
jgi:beta-glucanase (GH16 family)